METKHLYGLAAMLSAFGLICWLFAAWLWELALLALLLGLAAAVIGVFRLALPLLEQRHAAFIALQSLAIQERVIAHGERYGGDIRREASGTIEVLVRGRSSRASEPPPHDDEPEDGCSQEIPSSVRYEDIQSFIPKDHVLIGVGEGGLVDTREKEIKGLIWIPGSSGAGKSNTTALRVEEDYARGHKFIGIDPHFFKADSLSNLVRPYMDRFIEPLAYKQEDILRILNFFIAEAEQRKNGSSCWPLTLLYDEIGSQVSDRPEDDLEKEIIAKTKKAVRLAGQELRGFHMNLIAISQDAAGLAFLRKRALLVIGHKTVMMSERDLVCNGRSDFARQMDMWPTGRTVVYGVALQGILVRQQPLMLPRIVSSSQASFPGIGNVVETNGDADTADLFPAQGGGAELSTKKEKMETGNDLVETIKRMRARGLPHRDIAFFLGLTGRKYEQYQQLCREAALLEGEDA
jgi:hypothetical protein